MITLSLDAESGVAEAVLAQEPCNEIGLAMLEALEGLLDELDLERTRVLILRSGVSKGFSAGADLRQLYERSIETPEEEREVLLRSFLDRIHSVMDRLDMLPVATIGLTHGVCFGGGWELALTCDMLVAETSTRFCFPELRLGIIPGFGGIPRLQRELPNAVIRDVILTGRSINARRAQELGLVSQVVGRGEGLEVARAMAQQVARFEPQARRSAKAFMKPLPTEALADEKERFLTLFRNPAVLEALGRFVADTGPRPYLS